MARLTEYKRKRNFGKTAEPSGDADAPSHGKLRFVIQKHAASHLHYDLRLELGGVMKSWAVPKGPSVDPAVKRLAMEVEDHPMQYNTFEGTIPQGEYGGGTVMLWDRGTYRPDEAADDEDPERVLRREYRAGKMSFTLHGERLQGSWALVRTDDGVKPKWLMIKHRDEYARRYEATAEFETSVATDRSMEEIAGGTRVWHSNRRASAPPTKAGAGNATKSGAKKKSAAKKSASKKSAAKKIAAKSAKAASTVRPIRPKSVTVIPSDERVFLPWRGGERVLVYATADACALVNADGRDVSAEHSSIADGLASLASRTSSTFVMDGEVVTDSAGKRAALHVLDLIFLDGHSLAEAEWAARRAALEALVHRRRVPSVTLAPTYKSGERLLGRADTAGWLGVLAIDPASTYTPGGHTDAWLAVTAS